MTIFNIKDNKLEVFNSFLSSILNPPKDFGEITDVDNTIPLLSDEIANSHIENIKKIENGLDGQYHSFQEYYDKAGKSEKYIAQWAQATQGQIRTVEDLKKANLAARQSIIDENNAIQSQTLSAKAGSIALKGLAMAGNMVALQLVSFALQKGLEAWDNYIHRVERAKEQLQNTKEAFISVTSEVNELSRQISANNQLINELNAKQTLSLIDSEDLDQLKAVTKELERQLAIKQMEADTQATRLYGDNKKAFSLEFGADPSFDLNEIRKTADNATPETFLFDNSLKAQAANYLYTQNELESTADPETKQYAQERLDMLETELQEKLAAMQQYRDNLSSIMNYRDLTQEEQAFYQQLDTGMQAVYGVIDPSAWNRIELNDLFRTDGLEATKNELISMAKAGTLTPDTVKSYENLNKALQNSMFITEEGEDPILAFIRELETLGQTMSDAELTDSLSLDSESAQKAIDSFQSRVSMLRSALEDPENPETLAGLTATFPELAYETGNLSGAIRELIHGELNTLYDLLGEDIPPALKDALAQIAENAAAVPDAAGDLDRISDIAQSVSGFIEQIHSDGGISKESLSSVSALGEEYAALTDRFRSGLLSEEDLVRQLTVLYNTDLENYHQYQLLKYGDEGAFWDTLLENHSSFIQSMNENYGIDLSHCRSYNMAKLEIEAQTLGSVSAMWSKYYNAASSTMTGEYYQLKEDLEIMGSQGLSGSKAYQLKQKELDKAKEIKDQSKLYQEAMDALKTSANDTLDAGFRKLSSSASKASGSVKQLAGQVDSLTDSLEKQKSALEQVKSRYEQVSSAVSWFYDQKIQAEQNSIDSLEKQNEQLEKQQSVYDSVLKAVEAVYDKEIESLQAQQDAIQDKIDALRDANEEQERQTDLEKAQYALEQAQMQRSKYLFNGREFVYETDKEAITSARDSYNDAQLEIKTSELEKEKDSLQSSIDRLEKYKSMWGEISSTYEISQNDLLAKMVLGNEYQNMVLQNRTADVEAFKDNYISIQTQINDNQGLIDSYNEKIAYYESLKSQWEELTGQYQAQQNIQLLMETFGTDYEKILLDGRTMAWDAFAESYLGVQVEIDELSAKIETAMDNAASAAEAAAARLQAAYQQMSQQASANVTVSITKASQMPPGAALYHSGIKKGRVGDRELSSQEALNTLYTHATGDPVDSNELLAKLKVGEVVLTQDQQQRTAAALWNYERFAELSRDLVLSSYSAVPVPAVPSYLTNNANRNMDFTQNIRIELPNVKTGADANQIINQLSNLSLKATQYFNRRQ